MLRIATCTALPEPDPDEQQLLRALAALGIQARMASWDDPAESWDGPTVIRSTWNYIYAYERFLEWAARPAPLWNPFPIVRWNAHKSYLADLAARGLPVVPTRFYRRGEAAELDGVDGELVIKPAVSAASFGTKRFAPGERAAAAAHLDALLAERDAMVQPYVPSVMDYGERAVVWIDGAVTHAVRKAPRWSGGDEAVSDALPVAGDEREVAEAAVAPMAGELLYGRVDLARDERGRPMIMELELIEPSLFLLQFPPALERLSQGLARRLDRSGSSR